VGFGEIERRTKPGKENAVPPEAPALM